MYIHIQKKKEGGSKKKKSGSKDGDDAAAAGKGGAPIDVITGRNLGRFGHTQGIYI